MPPSDLVATFLGPLNRTRVPYIVTGSVASTLYGEPRLTQDIDLILRPTPGFAAQLTAAFRATDQEIWLAPIEYVILAKLDFFKLGGGDKHLADIAQMLRVSGDTIDREQLATWIERLGLEREWTAAVARFDGLRNRP